MAQKKRLQPKRKQQKNNENVVSGYYIIKTIKILFLFHFRYSNI